jgi:hypothetical protein
MNRVKSRRGPNTTFPKFIKKGFDREVTYCLGAPLSIHAERERFVLKFVEALLAHIQSFIRFSDHVAPNLLDAKFAIVPRLNVQAANKIGNDASRSDFADWCSSCEILEVDGLVGLRGVLSAADSGCSWTLPVAASGGWVAWVASATVAIAFASEVTRALVVSNTHDQMAVSATELQLASRCTSQRC